MAWHPISSVIDEVLVHAFYGNEARPDDREWQQFALVLARRIAKLAPSQDTESWRDAAERAVQIGRQDQVGVEERAHLRRLNEVVTRLENA